MAEAFYHNYWKEHFMMIWCWFSLLTSDNFSFILYFSSFSRFSFSLYQCFFVTLASLPLVICSSHLPLFLSFLIAHSAPLFSLSLFSLFKLPLPLSSYLMLLLFASILFLLAFLLLPRLAASLFSLFFSSVQTFFHFCFLMYGMQLPS